MAGRRDERAHLPLPGVAPGPSLLLFSVPGFVGMTASLFFYLFSFITVVAVAVAAYYGDEPYCIGPNILGKNRSILVYSFSCVP